MKIVYSIVILIIISSAAATRISKVSKVLENSRTSFSESEEEETKDTWESSVKVKIEVGNLTAAGSKTDLSSLITVTTEPKKTDKGLLFSSNLAGLNFSPATDAQKLKIFMTSNSDSNKTLIPFRKISSCTPQYSGNRSYKYEKLTVTDDLKGNDAEFKEYKVNFQNDYYTFSAAPLSGAKGADLKKFCANIMQQATIAQDAVRNNKVAILNAANSYCENTNNQLIADKSADEQKKAREAKTKADKASLKQNTDELAKLGVSNTTAKANIKTLEKELVDEERAKFDLIDQFNKIKNQIDEKNKIIEEKNEKLVKNHSTLAKNSQNEKVLKNTQESLNANILKLKEPIAKNDESKKKAEANLVTLNSHIKALKDENRGLTGLLKPLEETVESLKADKKELDAKTYEGKIQKNLDSIYPK